MFSFSAWISSQKSVCESYKHLPGFQRDLANLKAFESSEASKHSGLHSTEYWELALKDFKELLRGPKPPAFQRISVSEWVSSKKEYYNTLSSVAAYRPTADREIKKLSFFEEKALSASARSCNSRIFRIFGSFETSEKLLPLEWEKLYNECVAEYTL